MVIKKAIIRNFKNIEEMIYEPTKKVNVRTGKNGAGKTSFLQAIRYGITGEAPEDPVRYGAKEMSVYIELDDDTNFERIIKDNIGIVKVNGKKTTAKSLNEILQLKTGITQPIMKITSSAELASSLKPEELSTMVLNYIPDSQDIDSIISFINNIPQEISNDVINEITMLFPPMPEKFGTETIKEIYNTVVDIRKELKREKDSSNARLQSFVGEPPKENRKDLEIELEKLIKLEATQDLHKQALKNYTDAVENKAKQETLIKDLENKIAANKSTKPNPLKLDELKKQAEDIVNKKSDTIKIIQTLKNDINFLEKTIKGLNKPICPLSEKLICTTDKTQIKSELEELMSANIEGLSYQEKQLEQLIHKEKSIEEEKQEYINNQTKYNEKILLLEQLSKAKNNLPSIPPKPTIAANISNDIITEKKRIELLLEKVKKYEEHLSEKVRYEALEKRVNIYEFIAKALAPKGPVIDGIMGYYLPVFEKALNGKASLLKPELSIKLIYDNGIIITCEISKGQGYKPYQLLSSGEKILVQFLLLDMLNSLTGFKIIILDSLDQLDEEAFSAIMKLVSNKKVQDEYDHIFIAAVNHDDTVKALNTVKNIEWVNL